MSPAEEGYKNTIEGSMVREVLYGSRYNIFIENQRGRGNWDIYYTSPTEVGYKNTIEGSMVREVLYGSRYNIFIEI